MKKLIVTMLTSAILFAAVGCAVPEVPAAPGPTEQAERPQEADNGQEASGEETQEGASIFGKVKSIVGNEVELELARPPFDMGDGTTSGGSADADSFQVERSETVHADDGTDSAAVGGEGESGAVIAFEGADGQMQVVGGEGGDKMELEYTGESKSVLIPAGTGILNLLGGEGTLDNIKKGSVLMVGVEDENADTLKAKDVMIME